MFLRETLTSAAHEQGFVLVGFARLHPLTEREDFYRRWLADGGNASMTYLRERSRTQVRPAPPRRSLQIRRQPRLSVRGARDARLSIGAPRCAGESRRTHSAATITTSCKKRARAVGDVIRQLASRLDHAHLRRYRAGVRARMGVGFAHRMVRQEYDDSESRARLVFFSRRDFHRRGIRRERPSRIASIAGRAGDASICVRPARSPTAT